MSKCAKAQVQELLTRESNDLRKQKIYRIRSAMAALGYGAAMVSTTKRRQFLVHLNRA